MGKCLSHKNKWIACDRQVWTFCKKWMIRMNFPANRQKQNKGKSMENMVQFREKPGEIALKSWETVEMVEMHKAQIKVGAVFVQSSKFATCVRKIAKNG